MTEDFEERLVAAFELMATALTGIHDTQEKQFAKQWPERKEAHEAVYSRVPTEEDRIREEHGASDESLEAWLTVPEEEEYIGDREREFLKTHARSAASTQAPSDDEAEGRSAAAPEGQAGSDGVPAGDYPAV
jgi:hypothetical protein